jgi:hypothetical protein
MVENSPPAAGNRKCPPGICDNAFSIDCQDVAFIVKKKSSVTHIRVEYGRRKGLMHSPKPEIGGASDFSYSQFSSEFLDAIVVHHTTFAEELHPIKRTE